MINSGARFIETPTSWLGTPKDERRTMFGGVRIDSCTDAACSTNSAAISVAELPAPTANPRRPR